jgi:hypothetical protein
LVLEVPDTAGRYYVLGFLDFFTNPFASAGSRVTGTGARRFLIHGPRWTGDVPDAMTAIGCPTDAVWILGRILVDGPADVPEVNRLQDAFRLTPLDAWKRGESFAGDLMDTWLDPDCAPDDPDRFFEIVNRALEQNLPPAAEAELMQEFAAIGVGPEPRAGAPTSDEREAIAAAVREGLKRLAEMPAGDAREGWSLPVRVSASFGTDYRTRALVARNYIGALGVEDALYLMAEFDAEGARLDGHHSYRLDFAPGKVPPVDAFWSITMYRKSDRMLVDNPVDRYSIGDRTAGLAFGLDGTLSIAIQSDAPPAGANWLPAPREPFYLTLRAYSPRAEFITGAYRLPAVARVA